MSVDVLYRTTDLLSPCRFAENVRQQFYTNADQNNYNPGQEMRFSLPIDAVLDLSQSYIDFDFQPVVNGAFAITPETQTRFTIHQISTTTPNDGQFFINFNGESSIPLPFNATAAQVEVAIQAMIQIGGREYIVGATGGPLPGANIVVSIANFDGFNSTPEDHGYFTINSNSLNNAGATAVYALSSQALPYQPGILSSPRIERFLPIIKRMYVQVDSLTVMDCDNQNELNIIEQLIQNELVRDMRFYTGCADEFGTGLGFYANSNIAVPQQAGLRRLRLSLDTVGLFRKFLPVKVMDNCQIRIFLKLEDPTKTLIIGDATPLNNNPSNMSYQIQNCRLHYHTLALGQPELNELRALYEGKGITLDFRSWSNYTDIITAGTSNRNIIFNPSQRSLLGIFFTMYSIPYAGVASNHRKLSTFLKNNIDHFRLKCNTLYFPSDEISSSNTYPSYVQMVTELRRFVSLCEYKVEDGDMETFINYVTFAGNDPTQAILDIKYDETFNQACIMAISTSDVGYDVENRLCDKVALNGVNTANSPQVQLELYGMTATQDQQLNIFYLHQDFIIFKRDGEKVVWIH